MHGNFAPKYISHHIRRWHDKQFKRMLNFREGKLPRLQNLRKLAKATCMKDYRQPFLKHAQNLSTLYVDTNDLESDKTAESIANTIIDLATSLKNDQYNASISNIILRTDNTALNQK